MNNETTALYNYFLKDPEQFKYEVYTQTLPEPLNKLYYNTIQQGAVVLLSNQGEMLFMGLKY